MIANAMRAILLASATATSLKGLLFMSFFAKDRSVSHCRPCRSPRLRSHRKSGGLSPQDRRGIPGRENMARSRRRCIDFRREEPCAATLDRRKPLWKPGPEKSNIPRLLREWRTQDSPIVMAELFAIAKPADIPVEQPTKYETAPHRFALCG